MQGLDPTRHPSALSQIGSPSHGSDGSGWITSPLWRSQMSPSLRQIGITAGPIAPVWDCTGWGSWGWGQPATAAESYILFWITLPSAARNLNRRYSPSSDQSSSAGPGEPTGRCQFATL